MNLRDLLALPLAACGAVLLAADPASAQNSSLLARPMGPSGQKQPLMLQNVSLTYQQLPPPRQILVHDLITIRVDEKSQTFAEGSVERRKNQSVNYRVQDWILLDGLFNIKPAPQSKGDERIRGNADSLQRAESDLETRESMKFDITAEVVDIRPNGTLVLEAHRMLKNSEEQWEYSLSGICRKEDILDGNVVLSKSIAELNVLKRELGSVRDGYRRGWLLRWWDEFRAF